MISIYLSQALATSVDVSAYRFRDGGLFETYATLTTVGYHLIVLSIYFLSIRGSLQNKWRKLLWTNMNS